MLFSVQSDWVMDNRLCGMGPVICIFLFWKYEEKIKILIRMRSKSCLLNFSAEPDSFDILKKNPRL